MMNIAQIPIPYIIVSVFSLLLFIKLMLLQRDNKLLTERLTKAIVALEHNKKKLAELQQRHDEVKEFQKSIREAELTTKFQKPRLLVKQNEINGNSAVSVPEKYSYIRSLTEKGMSEKEIATLLSISTHEANQLVALTRLGAAA